MLYVKNEILKLNFITNESVTGNSVKFKDFFKAKCKEHCSTIAKIPKMWYQFEFTGNSKDVFKVF
jgi:hypothetical protein